MSKKTKNISGPESGADVHALAPAQKLFEEGLALYKKGQFAQAQALCQQALQVQSAYFDAMYLSGLIASQSRNPERAVELFRKAIDINPNNAAAHNSLGEALLVLKRHEAAIQSYEKAIALRPDIAELYYNRGNALRDIRQYDVAILSYDKAIALKPVYVDAFNNRGNALRGLNQRDAAIESYDKAIALAPDYAAAYFNRGVALIELKRHAAAVEAIDKAIALVPNFAAAHYNRGIALIGLKQHEAAIESYDKALALRPDYEFLFGLRLHTKLQICDWENVDDQLSRLAEKIHRQEKVSTPFAFLAFSDSASLQRKVAETWILEKCPVNFELPKIVPRSRRDRIRIGYFSADFRSHAVSNLAAELFETHDRSRFELTALSFGPDTKDEMRKRIESAFENFIDVKNNSDKEVAIISRNLEIDIAVDLGGLTESSRTGIFAFRAAPLQVNYLGYPGTMGAAYMDYLIADHTLIPESARQHYSEKIVYLPDSYQVNDTKRRISDAMFNRADAGLPQSGFVYCCFNNNYKIAPDVFDCWMRILGRVEGSVLWLLEDSPTAAVNLTREAAKRGINAKRLIFAKRMPTPEHLARHRLADLFLDTLPYNAHTTASDALWAGLPVLTCAGEAFVSRVAASLLNAMCLPELVTSRQADYEELAVELATKPEKLRQIRLKLGQNRLTAPLFDLKTFARNIESAYVKIYERYQAGLAPDHIDADSINRNT